MACDRCLTECEPVDENMGEDPLFPLPALPAGFQWPQFAEGKLGALFEPPRICLICGVVYCRPR